MLEIISANENEAGCQNPVHEWKALPLGGGIFCCLHSKRETGRLRTVERQKNKEE